MPKQKMMPEEDPPVNDWTGEMFHYAWDLFENGLVPSAIEETVFRRYSDAILDYPERWRPVLMLALARVFKSIREDYAPILELRESTETHGQM